MACTGTSNTWSKIWASYWNTAKERAELEKRYWSRYPVTCPEKGNPVDSAAIRRASEEWRNRVIH